MQNNAKDDNNYIFKICNEAYFKSMCKWIMELGATKHMISHTTPFYTYEIIDPCIVHLGDNVVVKAVGMGSHCRRSNHER